MSYEKVKKLLREARAMIATPDQWTQGAYRRSEGGKVLCVLDRDVASRCADGAIIDAADVEEVLYREAELLLLDAIELRTGERYLYLTSWNDSPERTHAEVLQAFDSALTQRN